MLTYHGCSDHRGAAGPSSNCGAYADRTVLGAGVAGFYYNSSRGHSYMFSTSSGNYSATEQACKDNGGHLTSWQQQEEQVGGVKRVQASP